MFIPFRMYFYKIKFTGFCQKKKSYCEGKPILMVKHCPTYYLSRSRLVVKVLEKKASYDFLGIVASSSIGKILFADIYQVLQTGSVNHFVFEEVMVKWPPQRSSSPSLMMMKWWRIEYTDSSNSSYKRSARNFSGLGRFLVLRALRETFNL